MRLLDTVALLNDRPDDGLVRGQVGTVVEELEGGVFEVEFVDDAGASYAVLPLHERELIVLQHAPKEIA